MARSRAPYLDLIDADRAADQRRSAGDRRRSPAPLAVAPGTPRRAALQRDLGRHYEQCKKDNRGRFQGARLKNYCAATAWTIVERHPTSHLKGSNMKRGRDSKGRFLKRSTRRRPKSGSERRRARPRPHAVRGYTMKRAGRRVRVRAHRASASAPRRSRARRSSNRRRRARGRSRGQTNIAIVPVGAREMGAYAPRRRGRRRYYAKAPPMATPGGLVIAGIGTLVGYQVTDMGDRFIAGYSTAASPAPTLPSGVTSIAQFNGSVQAAKPSLARIGWGLAMMLVGFGGGAIAPWAGLKMFAYGWGLGATANLGGRLLTSYVTVPLFTSNGAPTANGSRMYQHEIDAQNLLDPATTTTTASTTQGLGAPPGAITSRRGTPIAALGPGGRGLAGGQPSRVPTALASGRLGQQPPLTFSPAANAQILATQPPPFQYVPEGSSPPATSTPPASSNPPMQSPPVNPPQPPPQNAPPFPPPTLHAPPVPPPGTCGPCAPQPGPPQMGTPAPCACSGTSQCSCGQCGQPPEESPYRHPLFRTMLQSRDWSRRAA